MTHLRLLVPPASPPTPDEACLEAFQRELDYIHRTLRRLGVSSTDVEDLAQELFIALRRSWQRYDATRPLRPYLFGIAFRVASSHKRKTRREVPVGLPDMDDTAPCPDEALQDKRSRAMVLAALEHIPLLRRAVLVMRDLDDVPIDEVAAVLEIPVFTAYSRLRKARREIDSTIRRMLMPGARLHDKS